MSEEVEIEPNNITTTEDAFECFQANSMYEEEEFITLSDLVSPPNELAVELPEVVLEPSDLDENLPYEPNIVCEKIGLSEENIVKEYHKNLQQDQNNGSHQSSSFDLDFDLQINKSSNILQQNETSFNQDNSSFKDDSISINIQKTNVKSRRGRGRVNRKAGVNKDIEYVPKKSNLGRKRGRGRGRGSRKQHDTVENINEPATFLYDAPLEKSSFDAPLEKSSFDAPLEKSSFDALSNSNKCSEKTSRRQRRNKKDIVSENITNSDNPDIENANVVSSTISDICVSDTKLKRGRPKKGLKNIPATKNSSDETEVSENYLIDGVISILKKKKGQLVKSRQTRQTSVSVVNSSEQGASSEVTSKLPATLEHNITLNKNDNNPIAFDSHLQNDIIDSSSIAFSHEEEINLYDDGDDICLSELKTKLYTEKESSEVSNKNNFHNEETQNSIQSDTNTLLTEIATSEPIIEYFEYNTLNDNREMVDIGDEPGQMEIENMATAPMIIDNSKRPSRRRTKLVIQYDDKGSEEEDPFANVELSDDEPNRKRKGRYCSDDEYIPGKKQNKADFSTNDDSSDEQENEVESDRKSRKKKFNIFDKNGKIRSPKKMKSKKCNTLNNFNEDIYMDNIDIEESLSSSVLIKDTKDNISDFLAKKIQGTDIKIIKAKSSNTTHTLFEIPVLDQNEAKKVVETSTQTTSLQIRTTGVQTDTQYDHGIMKQVTLSSLEAEKACEFLKNVVGTTAELGELMTQKSKDFIAKKINTNHVTDTLKMDYCVKKSFLLFKLAKHNLLQMEEDLEKQYEEFLKSNNLLQYRESNKVIIPQTKSKEDSDCEIVEVPSTSKPKEKAQLNSKTVFLNKELSIKIAKKTAKTAKEPTKRAEKLNVKGRHTIWINDSIMVKKVKPTQSFLAQDSRNKKPPDYVSYEMVKQFFDNYKKERVLAICRPYTSVEWLSFNQEYVCNYFIKDTTDFQSTKSMNNVFSQPETVINGSANNLDIIANTKATTSKKYIINPKTLLILCIESIQKPFQPKSLLTICTEIMQKKIRREKNIKINEPFKNITSLQQYGENTNYECELDFKSTTLAALCLKIINLEVDSLMSLCIMKVNDLISNTEIKQQLIICDSESVPIYKTISNNNIKSFQVNCLSELCLKKIQKQFLPHFNKTTNAVSSLKRMTLQHINNLLLAKNIHSKTQNIKSMYIEENDNSMTMTINCVSTVTEEDFSNFEQLDCLNSPCDDNDDGDNDNDSSSFVSDNYNSDPEYGKCQHTEESNWVSKVQMQELSLCDWPSSKVRIEVQEDHNEIDNASLEPCLIQQVKLEPLEVVDNTNIENVKTEPADVADEATIPSAGILAKQEYIESISENLSDNRQQTTKENVHTFDVDIFESFMRSNKIIKGINSSYMLHNEEIFSQSSQRIRRQYDPDSDEENLNTLDSMGLLVPHSIEQAKDKLMEKSSDDDENKLGKIGKRKVARRKVTKRVMKDPSKEKPGIVLNEVTILTRRMKEKIRQKEKKNESSESDTDIPLQTRVEKQLDKIKHTENLMKLRKKGVKPSDTDDIPLQTRAEKKLDKIKHPENLIELRKKVVKPSDTDNIPLQTRAEKQLNKIKHPENLMELRKKVVKPSDTDDIPLQTRAEKQLNKIKHPDNLKKVVKPSAVSDDIPLQTRAEKQLDKIKHSENLMELRKKVVKPPENECGISVAGGLEKVIQCSDVDSTEFIKPNVNIPDSRNTKLKLKKSRKDQSINIQEGEPNQTRSSSSNFDLQEVPDELVGCESDISLQNETTSENTEIDVNKQNCIESEQISAKVNKSNQLEFIIKNGWKCYNINHNDSKLYDNVSIVLEKLPESFVDTYLRFQEICGKNENDSEVDRLTNLNSLHRQLSKDKNCGRAKVKSEFNKIKKVITEDSPNQDLDDTDHFTELTPSEDEDETTEDISMPEWHQNVDNSLAKNLLMDDNESDAEEINKSDGNIRIKQEPESEATTESTRTGSKSKTKATKAIENPDVMLTADIMMNKELTLLHTPVILNKQEEIPVDVKDTKTFLNKSSSRPCRKKRRQGTEKDEDDSSSEEEKQWVSTKEKMLKRMEKRQEVLIEDETKGAKRVSEFIEKRSDAPESRQRPTRGRKRSHKKLLEKRKQMKVLAKELFGEMVSGKRKSQTYGKGRRNIRKVIDKKSLARDTVLANMQEFERKQRLSHSQARLREQLGCEEGVNVVVINDELCLEYDFEKNLPIVTVHPYFTRVMKAHQYEGVKFMWDACFESVESAAGGRPGGGCILAHCMGLGKTLQVLALLHTVLTHPMLNTRRVLVCCPLSTVLNWVDEIHKWIGPVTNEIKVFELSKLKKTYERAYQLEDWYSGGGIFIIGYELFRNLTTLDPDIDDVRPTIVKKIRTALLDPGPDMIICDEGHLLKNDSSILAVAMSRVATTRRIVLTGTPMQNNLREYYCMVNFVKPHLLGTYFEYSNRFENPIMNGQHRDSSEEDIKLMKTRTHILHKVLEGCLQRQEASVLYPYLPKKYEYTVFIPLTKCQRELYTHYLERYASKGKQMVLKDFHTLQKVWTHPQVLHNFQTRARENENQKIKAEKIEDDLAHEDITASEDVKPVQTEVWWLQYLEGGNMLESLESSNKFQVVFKLLDECVALGDKVLIFSTSLYTMDTLEYFLRRINKWSLGQEYYRLDGSVPAEVRQKWCREFNAPHNHKTRLFLISTRAGSLGLNMTAANRVIILDTSWNPAHDIQSIFRVYRFGQKKDCFIYRLVAMGTMEQKIYERSVTKQAVSCRVVDEQQIDRHYNSAELTELYSLDEDGWGVLAGVATGVHDAALLRAAACGALHAVREHDSLLRGSEPALPEHERAAAWQQFQLEHADKHKANNVIAAKQLDQQSAAADVKPSTSALESLGVTPPPPPPVPGKPKRGRKAALAKEDTPARPEQQPNPEETDKEDGLVKKIMQILIAHNFHETIHLDDITSLIVNVRKLVASGMSDGFSIDDPVAASIASVLLQNQNSSAVMPPLSDANTAPREDLNMSDSVSDVASVSSDTNSSRRRRFSRQAALKAERQFDVIVDKDDTSIDVNDTEWAAGDATKKRNSSKLKQKEKSSADAVSQINTENVPLGGGTENSIVISDEEPDAPSVSTQLEKKKKKLTCTKNNRKRLKETPAKIDDSEEVPLHISLLTDENFIKIVAHTYLNGNPMLAEDAALMAAQYSTNKALREFQDTGAPILKGPIYDIAVKVLGRDLLKKMHINNDNNMNEGQNSANTKSVPMTDTANAAPPAPSATAQAPSVTAQAPSVTAKALSVTAQAPSVTAQTPSAIAQASSAAAQPVVLDDDCDIQVVKPPVVKVTKPVKRSTAGPKSHKKRSVAPKIIAPVIEKPPSPQPQPEHQSVFPVGMFVGLGEPAQSSVHTEECILPDDDDDVVLMPASYQTLPVSDKAQPKIKCSKPLSKQTPTISIDKGVISVPAKESTIGAKNTAPGKNVPEKTTPGNSGTSGATPRPTAAGAHTPGRNPTNFNNQQSLTESICLSDSDEEPAPASPVPVLTSIIGPAHTSNVGAAQASIIGPAHTSITGPAHASNVGPAHTSIVGAAQASIVGPAHTSIIGPAQASIVGPTHTSIVGPAHTSIIGPAQASIVGPAHTSIIGPAQASIVGPAHTSIISPAQASIVGPAHTSIIGPAHTCVMPPTNLLQTPTILSTSFRGSSPFILPPAIKRMLDPSKQYFCIPSSSFPLFQSTNINAPNAIVPDTNSVSDSVESQSNTLLKQQLLKPSSIVITGIGNVNLSGQPLLGTPTRPNSLIEKDHQSNFRAGDFIGIDQSGRVEILEKVSGKKIEAVETVEVMSKRMTPDTVDSESRSLFDVHIPTTSAATNSLTDSRKCQSISDNDLSTSSNDESRQTPSPTEDPLSIFKNVIHIQAPSNDQQNHTPITKKMTPNKRTSKTPEYSGDMQKSVVQKDYKKSIMSILKKTNATKTSIAITKKTTMLSSKKPAVSVTLDLTGPGSDDDKKKQKLEILKRLEQAKWANNSKTTVYDSRGTQTTTSGTVGKSGASRSNTSSQSGPSRSNTSSQSGPSRSKTSSPSGPSRSYVITKSNFFKDNPSKSKTSDSFIDLTNGFSVLKSKGETKRPSPWTEPAVKKPKRMQTLEDFDLDDIEDITELE